MSRDWPPDGKIVRIRPVRGPAPRGSAEAYLPRRRRRLGSRVQATVVLGAVFAGVLGWVALQHWPAQPVDSGPAAPIEWNAVQAVPTRTPDAADFSYSGQEIRT